MSDPTAGPTAGPAAGPAGTSGARRALIIANDTYDHASLSQLRAPEADARALADVLGDPEVGGFDVTVVHNEASYDVQARIDDLFADSRPDDLVLLHFSGHGLKSDSGELFFAARNTRPDRLGSTAVAADFVQRCMRSARARTIVLFLDCCYGGAFGEGVAVRAAGPVNVVDSFPAGRLGGGRGRAVISASSAMEYAFEGTTLTADHEPQPSIFTSAVVDGLRSGEADRDEDGFVALGELYDYVFDRVREQNPRQTPGRDVEMSGEVFLARSRRRRIRAVPISDALTAALGNPDPTYRRGAVLELRDRLGHSDLGVALGALEALRQVVRSDTKSVADDAAAVIAGAVPSVSPRELDFGELAPETLVAVERELVVTGLPLAREVSVEAEPPLSAVVEGDRVTVSFSPTGRAYAGSLRLVSPTGAVVVPAKARVADRWAAAAAPPASMTSPEASPPTAPQVASPATTPAATSATTSATTSAATQAVSGAASAPEGPEPAAPELAERRLTPVRPADPPAGVAKPLTSDLEPKSAPSEGEAGPKSAPPGTKPTKVGPTAPGAVEAAYGTGETDSAHRLGRWPAWVFFVGALLVVVGSLAYQAGSDSPDYTSLFFPVVGGLIAVSAGALILSPQVRVDVAVWFLVPVTAAAGISLISALFRAGQDSDSPGWWATFVGLVLIALTGLLVLVSSASRSPLPTARIAWRDPVTLAVLVAAVVLAILLGKHAAFLISDGAGARFVSLAVLWAAMTVVNTLLALAARPSAAGRLMILAWCAAVVGYMQFEWDRNSQSDAIGLPLVVTVAVVLAVAGGFIGRRVVSDSTAG